MTKKAKRMIYPASLFTSMNNAIPECNPIAAAICRKVGIDPADPEAGVVQVEVDEAFQAIYGEDCEDHETAGDYYYVSNRTDGYGYLVSAGKGLTGASTREGRITMLEIE